MNGTEAYRYTLVSQLDVLSQLVNLIKMAPKVDAARMLQCVHDDIRRLRELGLLPPTQERAACFELPRRPA